MSPTANYFSLSFNKYGEQLNNIHLMKTSSIFENIMVFLFSIFSFLNCKTQLSQLLTSYVRSKILASFCSYHSMLFLSWDAQKKILSWALLTVCFICNSLQILSQCLTNNTTTPEILHFYLYSWLLPKGNHLHLSFQLADFRSFLQIKKKSNSAEVYSSFPQPPH